MFGTMEACYQDGRRLVLRFGGFPPGKEGVLMDVFQLMQTAGFALAFFMAGYSLGKKK